MFSVLTPNECCLLFSSKMRIFSAQPVNAFAVNSLFPRIITVSSFGQLLKAPSSIVIYGVRIIIYISSLKSVKEFLKTDDIYKNKNTMPIVWIKY